MSDASPPAHPSSLRSGDVEALLQRLNWREVERREGWASLWRPEGAREEGPEILVPEDTERPDYLRLINRALDDIGRVVGLSPAEVAVNASQTRSDVLRIRDLVETGPEYSVPLTHGIQLVDGVRKLLIAGAAATDRKRPYFGRSKKRRASGIGDKVHLGQTDRGSFVLTLLVAEPVLDRRADTTSSPELDTEPTHSYERRALVTAMRALAATRNAVSAAQAGDGYGPFLDAVAEGVSADLCEAVIELTSSARSSGVEFEVSWAARPRSPVTPASVGFEPRDVPTLQEAHRRLRPDSDRSEFELVGTVEGLRRNVEDPEGLVTIRGTVDGQQRLVRVPLQGDSYSLATRLHDSRDQVEVVGDLVQERGTHYLFNAGVLRRVADRYTRLDVDE